MTLQGVLEDAFPDNRSLVERLLRQPPRLRWVSWTDPDGSTRVRLDGWPLYVDRAVHMIHERYGIADGYQAYGSRWGRVCKDLTLTVQAERSRA